MKNFKRLVSTLLCVVTIFMLATPAMAIDVNNDKMPVITQHPKDIVIVEPFGSHDRNPGPIDYYPEIELLLSDIYTYEAVLYCGDKCLSKDYFKADEKPNIKFNRERDKAGEHYIVITNRDYPEYSVKSEPFNITFTEKPLSEKILITMKSIVLSPYYAAEFLMNAIVFLFLTIGMGIGAAF